MDAKVNKPKRLMSFIISIAMISTILISLPVFAADNLSSIYTAADVNVSGGSVATTGHSYEWNSSATPAMKSLFGNPLNAKYYTKMFAMNGASRKITKTVNVTSSDAGNYSLYILGKEYNERYYRVQVDGGTLINPDATSGVKVGVSTTGDSRSLAVTTYAIGKLTEGTHTITITPNASNNSQEFFAMGFLPLEKKEIYNLLPSQLNGGNYNTTAVDQLPYTFVDNADPNVKALTQDPAAPGQLNSKYAQNYRNYIGKTTDVTFTGLNLDPGLYNIYYLGGWNDKGITARIDSYTTEYIQGDSIKIASAANNADRTEIKLYKMPISIGAEVVNGKLTISSTDVGQYLPDLFSVIIAKQPEWGNGMAESGWYFTDDTETVKEGIIRFFQGYNGENVSEYGFYFVDSKGTSLSTVTKLNGSTFASTNEGFYGDLIAIPDADSSTFYAKAYVVVNDVVYWSDSISSAVDWNKHRPTPTN